MQSQQAGSSWEQFFYIPINLWAMIRQPGNRDRESRSTKGFLGAPWTCLGSFEKYPCAVGEHLLQKGNNQANETMGVQELQELEFPGMFPSSVFCFCFVSEACQVIHSCREHRTESQWDDGPSTPSLLAGHSV